MFSLDLSSLSKSRQKVKIDAAIVVMILKRVILKCVASACTCYMCSAGIAHSVAEWNPPLESF